MRLLNTLILFVLSVTLFSCGGGGAADPDPNPNPNPGTGLDATALAMFNLSNTLRTGAGLNALTVREELTQAAQQQANHMLSTGTVSKDDAAGDDIATRIFQWGLGWSFIGENVGVGPDPASVFADWQGDPSGSYELNRPEYTEIGVAYAGSPPDQYWSVVYYHVVP